MRLAACVLVGVVLSGCGSAVPGSRVERYGISLEAPEGWEAEISRGLIRIRRGDLSVTLYEYETANASEAAGFGDQWPVTLLATDFGERALDDESARLVSVAGRLFSVFAGTRRPSRGELEDVNAALARIEVEAGDFYPGSAQPVEFPDRPGWHIVSSGPTPRYAYGEFVQTAAATIPYRNAAQDLPPARTLEALPREGILVWVGLSRDSHVPPSRLDGGSAYVPRPPPPYGMADLERVDGWEGQVRDIPEYRLWASTRGRYLLDLRVYFGQARPTAGMLSEADAALRALRFPDWGPWELEAA